uniref:Uncharacterized protein n=1 Tax=Cacopsylla melanoneura TaxID=428564 RepID=A0A8D8S2F7_9HEMI
MFTYLFLKKNKNQCLFLRRSSCKFKLIFYLLISIFFFFIYILVYFSFSKNIPHLIRTLVPTAATFTNNTFYIRSPIGLPDWGFFGAMKIGGKMGIFILFRSFFQTY